MAKIKIGRLMMGICQTNCYFVYEEGKTDVIFIDPADQGGYLYDALKERGFSVAAIYLTHGHFDHIWGAEELRQKSGAKIYAYEGERALCMSDDLNVSARTGRACTIEPDVDLKDGEELTTIGITCKVIATPGHTSGSCCYYFPEGGFVISGDTLFADSVGRTDLPTGSMGELVRSIRERLFLLPDDTIVYPGHGDATEIGHEKKYNPFVVE